MKAKINATTAPVLVDLDIYNLNNFVTKPAEILPASAKTNRSQFRGEFGFQTVEKYILGFHIYYFTGYP